MRKALALIAAVLLALVVSAPSATAASPHFKKGGSPTCTISSSTGSASTVCRASLAGLGNGDVVISVTVRGFAVYTCQNNGGQTAPGQNKVLEGPVTTPTTIPGSEIKNGNLSFVTDPAVLTAKDTVTAGEAGCPNPNWTGVDPVLTVTSISMTIAQGGTTFFTCSASDPNGLTGTVALTC